MSRDYDATVLRDYTNWSANTVRLMVREQIGHRTFAFLMGDGTWQTVEEGTVMPSESGLILPASSIEPIARAVAEFQGHVSHADTEARVLREWLTVERARVDQALVR